MSATRYILASLLAGSTALAHCQLAWPYPLHSALNPATPEALKDYSMTSPLVSDGTYPCKGFINNPASGMDSVVTWDAGATINYTIAGTATHGGGSCQISMSYDSGSTWNVIYSHVGGCLIDGMTEEITIPTDAPSGEALFAWGWFNLQGNREMYHNCASVTLTNGGQGLNDDNDYPTPFVANAGTDINDCITIENTAVVFPSPGKNVKYGGSYASTQPTTPAGFTGSNCVGPGATSSSSSSSNSTSSSSSNSTSSSSSIASNTSSSTAANAASSAPTTTSADATSTATATAASSHTTLWSGSASASASAGVSVGSSSSGAVSAVAANATPSSSSSAVAATSSSSGKTCKSKRKRAIQSNAEPRHERLVRKPRPALPLDVEVAERDEKRVAAGKATHKHNSKRDGKRIAASKATHNVKRDGRITNEDEERRAEGRVAANKASHVEKRRTGLRGLLGLSHS